MHNLLIDIVCVFFFVLAESTETIYHLTPFKFNTFFQRSVTAVLKQT